MWSHLWLRKNALENDFEHGLNEKALCDCQVFRGEVHFSEREETEFDPREGGEVDKGGGGAP